MKNIAMGSAALTRGFALLGFETYPDATVETLEHVLEDLLRQKEKAVVFLEHHLARSGGPFLSQVRSEGGRIVVAEVPPLATPADYHPPVEELVKRILGPAALEEKQ